MKKALSVLSVLGLFLIVNAYANSNKTNTVTDLQVTECNIMASHDMPCDGKAEKDKDCCKKKSKKKKCCADKAEASAAACADKQAKAGCCAHKKSDAGASDVKTETKSEESAK
jgi:hypothetical protein